MNYQEYLDLHGINQASVDKFELTQSENRLVIPIKDSDGVFIYNKYRNLDYSKDNATTSKYAFDKDSHPTLFNLQAVKDSSYVVICEGEIDAIRLSQEGITAVSSTGGAGTFKTEWIEYFKGKNVFLCYDSDKAGIEAALKIGSQMLTSARIISLPEETKDVSDYFVAKHTKEDFFQLVKEARMIPLIPVITGAELLNTPFPEESYIVDKILGEQSITLLVGEAGTFKSYLALDLTKHLITQEPFLGHFQVLKKCRILVIDKENKLRRLKQRMMGLSYPETDNLFFMKYPEKFMLDSDEFLTEVANFIIQQKIDVVILDSFIDMFEGSENSSNDTSVAINGIRALSSEASFILLHHDSKPMPKMTRTAGQKTRGSSNIIAQVDAQFYLDKGKDLKSFTVEQGKSRDDEPLKKFTVNLLTEEGKVIGFEYGGEIQDEVTKIAEAKELIYQFIKEHSMCTKDEIREFLIGYDIKPATTKVALEASMKMGIIDFSIKPGHGKKHFYFAIEQDINDDENS